MELVKRHIPQLCAVQNSADSITGQLMISDISEQDQHASVLNCCLRHHIDLLRYICLPVRMCACVRARAHVCVRACARACMCACVIASVCVSLCNRVHSVCDEVMLNVLGRRPTY